MNTHKFVAFAAAIALVPVALSACSSSTPKEDPVPYDMMSDAAMSDSMMMDQEMSDAMMSDGMMSAL